MKITKKTPQFTLEQLYASPFTSERKFRPDGSIYWEELTDTIPITGIDALDEFLRLVRAGNRTVKVIASLMGLSTIELNAFLKILTGHSPSEFIRFFMFRQAQQLLQYTDLTIDDIAKRCGYRNNANLTQSFTPVAGVTPSIYRRQHQRKLDRGRFRIT